MHSYISKCQLKYLKKSRSEIDDSSIILFLDDFAENYHIVIQDKVQGFHWNNSKCTLHPVVTYFQENDELKNTSYCIISDDSKHDAALIYEVQKAILADLKCKLFKFVYKADADNTRVILNERFEGVTWIPGTRSFHKFSPIDQYFIELKKTSKDKEPSYVHNFKNQTKQNSVVQTLGYVSFLHDKKWWVGIITNLDTEEDVQVKFMHPSSTSRSF